MNIKIDCVFISSVAILAQLTVFLEKINKK